MQIEGRKIRIARLWRSTGLPASVITQGVGLPPGDRSLVATNSAVLHSYATRRTPYAHFPRSDPGLAYIC